MKAIDIWMLGCDTFVFVAFLEFTMAQYLLRKSTTQIVRLNFVWISDLIFHYKPSFDIFIKWKKSLKSSKWGKAIEMHSVQWQWSVFWFLSGDHSKNDFRWWILGWSSIKDIISQRIFSFQSSILVLCYFWKSRRCGKHTRTWIYQTLRWWKNICCNKLYNFVKVSTIYMYIISYDS